MVFFSSFFVALQGAFHFLLQTNSFSFITSRPEKTPVAKAGTTEKERKAEPGGKLMFSVLRPKY